MPSGDEVEDTEVTMSEHKKLLDKWHGLLRAAREVHDVQVVTGKVAITQDALNRQVTRWAPTKTPNESVGEVPAVEIDEGEQMVFSLASMGSRAHDEAGDDQPLDLDSVRVYNLKTLHMDQIQPTASAADGGAGSKPPDRDGASSSGEDEGEEDGRILAGQQHSGPPEVEPRDGAVYLVGSQMTVPLEDFLCSETQEPLGDTDFLFFHGKPMSRKAYLQKFGDQVDAATLEPLRDGDNVVMAMGCKWKLENFKCAHSGVPLDFGSFIPHEGKPYSEEGYCEKFRICPGCSDVVELDDQDAVMALGSVWHTDHFCCSNPECEEPELYSQMYFSQDRHDGLGLLPYCQSCFAEVFCPSCQGCGNAIMPSEDMVRACGSTWHKEHFRCAATGALLEKDYFAVDGLPYCEEAYFEHFAHRCALCLEVIRDNIISTLERHWHPECFICSGSGLPLHEADGSEEDALLFFEHELMPYRQSEWAKLVAEPCHYCNEVVVDDLRITRVELKGVSHRRVYHPECLRCFASKRLLDPSRDDIMFGIDDGLPYYPDEYFTKYGRDFIDGKEFTGEDDIFLIDGLPLRQENYLEIMCDSFCAGCGKPIVGVCKLTPKLGNLKWHPKCLDDYFTQVRSSDDVIDPYELSKTAIEAAASKKEEFHAKVTTYKADSAAKLADMKTFCLRNRSKFKTQNPEAIPDLLGKKPVKSITITPPEDFDEDVDEGEYADELTPLANTRMSDISMDSSLSRRSGSPGPMEGKSSSTAGTPGASGSGRRSTSARRSSVFRSGSDMAQSRRGSRRGYLMKKGGGSSTFGRRTWQNRFFVLQEGKLSYYKNKEDYGKVSGPLKNAVYKIPYCTVEPTDEKNAGILICPSSAQGGPRDLSIRCSDAKSRDMWLQALEAAREFDEAE